MYPLLRTFITIMRARRRPKLDIDGESVLNLRVGLTDVDIFGELNNARHLSMMEIGRWDFSQRVGFISLMRKKKWAVVMGGASLRYRRRLPFWSRYQLSTRMLCHDGRWFYFLQETKRNNQVCSSALIKAGVSSPDGLVDAPLVAQEMGLPEWGETIPDWIAAWIEAEGQRPWVDTSEQTT